MIKPLLLILLVLLARVGAAAEVPKSPYIAIVYRYGDALIKNNRDTHSFGQNDLRLLYTLSELSNKPIYRDTADAELKSMLRNPGRIVDERRVWMLWDRCFQIAPEQARIVAQNSDSIRAFAAAYGHTNDEKFLQLIESALPRAKSSVMRLSLPIDAWGAAGRVPEPLASKLRRFAEVGDELFLRQVQPWGLNLWKSPPEERSSAALGMLCVSRFENCGNAKYRERVCSVADLYCNAPIPNDADISPMTFGHAISLELAAWRFAAKQEYLQSARHLADEAVKRFWINDSPLPKISHGADTLALSLLELHLSILHITAVRCPPNTIDR